MLPVAILLASKPTRPPRISFDIGILRRKPPLSWILKLFAGPPIEQSSAFLDLPLDVLCSICDELPLPAKILLSQSCKAMWHMLHSTCSSRLRTLAQKDRFDTLRELGNLLPDNYYCTRCNVLHLVEPDDVPNVTNWYKRRHVCYTPGRMFEDLCLQHYYIFAFHHVQLALKYSRMTDWHQDYRTNILQQFETRPVGSPIIKSSAAKPKVVNARLILLVTYVLYADALQYDLRKSDLTKYIHFCPHHFFGIGSGLDQSIALMLQEAAIKAATMPEQHTQLFTCNSCPTDYSVMPKMMRFSSRLGMT